MNATRTDKLIPLVIGKFLHPRCFKNNLENIEIKYRARSKAWMTGTLFQEWLTEFDKQIFLKIPERKILLILDNVGSHNITRLNLKSVSIRFLPPNMTSRLQPLDTGIIV